MNNNEKPSSIKLDLTWTSILRVVIVLLGLFFLYLIRDIITLLFIVYIVVAALNPVVSYFQSKMPRPVAVILVYLLLFLILFFISVLIFNPLAKQLSNLAQTFPLFLERLTPSLQLLQTDNYGEFLQKTLQNFSGRLSDLTGNIFQTIANVFGGVLTAMTVIVMSFYLLLDEKGLERTLQSVIPHSQIDNAGQILQKFADKLGSWLRAQILLMIIIGVLDYILLLILQVEAPLALATWGGLTEIIPFVGPLLGAIPAIIITASTKGFFMAVVVAAIMIGLIQWIESQIIVPNVMKKAVGLSPIIVILALLIGGKLMGIVGVILAVPVAALISVVVLEWDNIKKIYHFRSK